MSTQISTATNLTGPNVSKAVNDANKYFNNFYSRPLNVSADTNDAITGFFEQYTSNKAAASNLAAAVLYTAMAQNLNPMSVLSEFEKLPKGQLDNYLVAFLNANRVPTSLLGTKTTTKTSPYVTRSILL
jgi:hypothetical protein